MRTIHITTLLVLVATAAGCSSDAIDPVINQIECGDVCERYADCFDDDYDVDACTDRCEDDTASSEERERKLRRCNDCIDDESCTASAFKCATDCAGIVP